VTDLDGMGARMPRRLGVLVVVTALVAALPAMAHRTAARAVDSPVCTPRRGKVATGTMLTYAKAPDRTARRQPWIVTSPAMSGRTEKVNVLVPAGYSPTAAPYQVLYLLHGHGGSANDWWSKTGTNGDSLEKIVGGLPLIVVMPDGGYDGWYSDWYGVDVDGHSGAAASAPAWETFHTAELIRFIDTTYHVRKDRGGRLIAGLSMGGFGALSYAARHPDLFAAAGSFSGAIDTRLFDPVEPLVQATAANAADRQPPDQCVWGDGITQKQNWIDHNPADHAATLATMPFYASSGDGCLPSTFNPDPGAPAACQAQGVLDPAKAGGIFTEWGVRQQNESFRQKVCPQPTSCRRATFHFYSGGIHDWPFWLAELRTFLAWAHTTARVL
jgi:S-formylglutathione hydrolase FrmB